MDDQTPLTQSAAVIEALHGRVALSVPEFAAVGGWSRQHIYNEISRGHIRTFRSGRTRRIAIDEVVRILGGAVA